MCLTCLDKKWAWIDCIWNTLRGLRLATEESSRLTCSPGFCNCQYFPTFPDTARSRIMCTHICCSMDTNPNSLPTPSFTFLSHCIYSCYYSYECVSLICYWAYLKFISFFKCSSCSPSPWSYQPDIELACSVPKQIVWLLLLLISACAILFRSTFSCQMNSTYKATLVHFMT